MGELRVLLIGMEPAIEPASGFPHIPDLTVMQENIDPRAIRNLRIEPTVNAKRYCAHLDIYSGVDLSGDTLPDNEPSCPP
jgi:hypothetical protein